VKHQEAEASMAAERYVLGELHDSELEQFEEHFFSCPACAQDVRDLAAITEGAAIAGGAAITEGAAIAGGAALTGGAREVLKQPRKTEPPKQRAAAPAPAWRWPWLRLNPGFAWAGALAVVTLFAGYQTQQLQVAMRPQAVAAIVLKPETRGEPLTISMDKAAPFLRPLAVDLPGATGRLQWEIQRTGSEKVIFQDAADAPEPDQLFQVLLPSSRLAPGDYTLTVRSITVPSWQPRFFTFKLISSGR
jgi:hypothetical protein